jgi:hypothetical protein
MRRFALISLLTLILTGCAQPAAPKPTALPAVTEVTCQGVEPHGLSIGMQAYDVLDGPILSAALAKEADSKESAGSITHHTRVTLVKGPVCSTASAWWLVRLPDGSQGWLRVGPSLEQEGTKYAAALLPYTDDAVQRDVPKDREKEAQIRYIIADIELGGSDVQKYYEDQAAAKPDDPETVTVTAALDIVKAGGGKGVLANASAFERKPFRGGTSVLDAGTEYVQPGLDIVLTPCDGSTLEPICAKLK